jgi:predicted Zn-dependent protease with MMP-like domain
MQMFDFMLSQLYCVTNEVDGRLGPEVDVRERPKQIEELVESAFARLAEGRAEDALSQADAILIRDDALADAHAIRALALTMLVRIEQSDAAFDRAAELDPDEYFRPYRLDENDFDAAVEEVLSRLPRKFRDYLENVEIGVEEVPSPELIADDTEFDVLGVYVGATAISDDWDFPDRVVLFQRNLENISPDRETLLSEIRDTLLHEVGHHFGMDEDALREIEDAG